MVQAAYRALMRRYHPDANASAEAAERARSINAAYAVLGDPDRRAGYDALRAQHEIPPLRPRRTGPIATGLISAVALGLLLFAILSPPSAVEELDEPAFAQIVEASVPEPSVAPKPESIAAAGPDVNFLPQPVRASVEEELPGIAAAAAPSTAARAAVDAQQPRRPPAVAAIRPANVAAPAPAAAAPAKPSFDCRFASAGAEKAVCRDSNLALLDDRMAVLYSQSWGRADQARRAMLLDTRNGFVERRDRCGSDSCIADTYLKRMREISDIMGGRGQPR